MDCTSGAMRQGVRGLGPRSRPPALYGAEERSPHAGPPASAERARVVVVVSYLSLAPGSTGGGMARNGGVLTSSADAGSRAPRVVPEESHNPSR